MRLGTRLLLIVLPVVLIIMAGYGTWNLREREAALVAEARREAHVYARAVGLAFEYALRTAPRRDVRRTLNRITLNPAIFGVAIFDTAGNVLFASDLVDTTGGLARAQVRAVLDGADSLVTERTLAGQRVYAIVRSVRDARGRILGVLEVTQPLDFIGEDLRRTRQRFVALTLGFPAPELEIEVLIGETGIEPARAARLVRLAGALRALKDHDLEEGASTRLLVYAATLMRSGMAEPDACRAAAPCISRTSRIRSNWS